jgi:hypothetical protein
MKGEEKKGAYGVTNDRNGKIRPPPPRRDISQCHVRGKGKEKGSNVKEN